VNHYPITISDVGALDPNVKASSDKKREALIAFAKTPSGMATFGASALIGSALGGKKHRLAGAAAGLLAVPVIGATLGVAAMGLGKSPSDTGGLNIQGSQFLGVLVGMSAGLALGKGKVLPAAIGGGIGYAVSHTSFFQGLTK
jgi:hypothetical protein